MKKVIFYVWILTLLTSCSEVLLLGSLGGAVVSQSPAIKAYNGVDAVTIMKTKKEAMSEHEEDVNADVPREIWIQRNKFLHKHIETLEKEINDIRRDNIKLTQQIEDQLKQFRNTGGL